MRHLNIIDLQTEYGLFGESELGVVQKTLQRVTTSDLSFLSEFGKLADIALIDLYGSFLIRKMFIDENDDFRIDVLEWTLAAAINKNSYKLKTLYETTQFEYNPIQNYNMTEHREGEIVMDRGAKKNTNTNQMPQTTIVNESSVAPNNASSYYPKNKDVTTQNEYTSTMTAQQNEYQDIDADEYTLTRSGNIGVTTTQQMVQAQREVGNFNFVDILTRIVVDTLVRGVQFIA